MPRRPYPHEELVRELKKIIANLSYQITYDDDTDQWYTETMGRSPMDRQAEERTQARARAEAIGQELAEIGEPAAEAVALGLRMRGTWREYLLPFVDKHKDVPVIAEAVALVKRRERDKLREKL